MMQRDDPSDGGAEWSWRQRAFLRATRFPASIGVLLGGVAWLPLRLMDVVGFGSLVYFVMGGILLTVLVNGLWRYRRFREARRLGVLPPSPGLPPMKTRLGGGLGGGVSGGLGERDE